MTSFWTLSLSSTIALASPPDGVVTVDLIQPVEVHTPFVYEWNAERAHTDQVTILVVEVRPGSAPLRQTATPLLYVGPTPAARIHPGETDDHLVVFVPGHPDLSKTAIFWGPDTLAERVTAEMGVEAQASSGAQPFPKSITEPVTQPTIQVQNQGELYGHMAGLIDTYAPADKRFSTSIRVTLQQ